MTVTVQITATEYKLLREAMVHLHCAIVQSISCDDQIIMEHVRDANKQLNTIDENLRRRVGFTDLFRAARGSIE